MKEVLGVQSPSWEFSAPQKILYRKLRKMETLLFSSYAKEYNYNYVSEHLFHLILIRLFSD